MTSNLPYNAIIPSVIETSPGGERAFDIFSMLLRGRIIFLGAPIDDQLHVDDAEMLETLFDLAEHEGLVLGGSSGVNVAGAIRTARALGPGHVVVTMLCDYGHRYQSKLYNPDFLRARDLPVPPLLAFWA